MSLEEELDGMFLGGADGAFDALCVSRSKRVPRALTSREWPPTCETGLCGSQGCLCHTRNSTAKASRKHEFVLDEFGSMMPLTKTFRTVAKSSPRTEVKRARSRRRKHPLPMATLPTPARIFPTSGGLVDCMSAQLSSEVIDPAGRKMVKRLASVFVSESLLQFPGDRMSDNLPLRMLLCNEKLPAANVIW